MSAGLTMETDWLITHHDDPLYETNLWETNRVAAIHHACSLLEQGAQFSFYDLGLSEQEQFLLSHVKVHGYYNPNFYLSQIESFEQKIRSLFSESDQIEIDEYLLNPLAYLVTRIVSNVLAAVPYQNAEVILRAEPAGTNQADCLYWHIDKSHGEISQSLSSLFYPISAEKQQALFVLPLLGNTTLFKEIDPTQRLNFLSMVNETEYYYGHTVPCSSKDKVNTNFQSTFVKYTKKGYGSVHLTGRNGALHTAPHQHNQRIVLLITPIHYNN